MCYSRFMAEVASRELRNDTRGLLRRVAAGEDIVITVDGQAVAVLRPLRQRPRWINRKEFARRLARRQADSALFEELRGLAPDTTDDLPL
jgi:prevent-host-death family protein